MSAVPYLDLDRWPRRDAFDYFRHFDKPFFNVCTRLDLTRLRQAVQARDRGGLALAYHFVALRLCNAIEPFRYRIEGERVRVHPVVDGSLPCTSCRAWMAMPICFRLFAD